MKVKMLKTRWIDGTERKVGTVTDIDTDSVDRYVAIGVCERIGGAKVESASIERSPETATAPAPRGRKRKV